MALAQLMIGAFNCVEALTRSKIVLTFAESRQYLLPLIYVQRLSESVHPLTSCVVDVSISMSYAVVVAAAAAAVEGWMSVGRRSVIVPSSIGSPYCFPSLSSAIRPAMYLDAWERLFLSLLY